VVRVRGVVGAYGTSEGGTWLRLHGESRPGRAAGRDSATVWVGSGHAGLAAVRALRAGDLVEVTGVAATYQDNPGDAPVWQVIPRRDADVVTLGLPGRWSELAAMAGAAFVALLLAAAVGARVLNRRHARALAETEGRYRQLLALCPDAVLVHAEGRVLFANPAAARLLGTPDAAALAGRALADFQLAAVAPDAAAAAAGAERARFRAVGGAAVDVEVTTSPCRYHDRDAAVLIARDVGARLRYERELRELALLDELTGLHNRRGFHTFAEAELRRAVITGREVHLVFADLDGLKLINDGFGHAAGDAALRAVARALHDLVGAQGTRGPLERGRVRGALPGRAGRRLGRPAGGGGRGHGRGRAADGRTRGGVRADRALHGRGERGRAAARRAPRRVARRRARGGGRGPVPRPRGAARRRGRGVARGDRRDGGGGVTTGDTARTRARLAQSGGAP
jgi:PAS domain S-box-containing protein